MSSISTKLAEFAVNLKYEDIPENCVLEAKRFLIDSLGCAIGGFLVEDCEHMHELFEELGGKPECTVFGSGMKTNSPNAAFLNSLMIRAMDYNDIYWKADPSHPSDIIPAALALGEVRGRSGKDLIVGIIIGHEIEMRLCEIGRPGIREVGWHHATLTGFASPLVAAKMCGLSVEQTMNAVGISACHSGSFGSVTAGVLTMMKNTVDPLATRNGVLGALMAEKGITGPELILEGREGLRDAILTDWDTGPLLDTLGKEFKIPQCSMKPYPSEFLTHSPISAAIQIKKDNNLDADDIKEIVIHTIGRGVEILCDKDKYDPHSKETADHSLPYCLAVAFVDGEVTPESFSQKKIRDPKVLENCRKVKGVVDPELEKLFPDMQPTIVKAITKDGKEFVQRVDFAKGDPRNPMSEEELLVKFNSLAAAGMSEDARKKLVDAVMNLEKIDRVSDLMALTKNDL